MRGVWNWNFLEGFSTSLTTTVTHWVAGIKTGRELSTLNMLMLLGGLLLMPVKVQNLFKKIKSDEKCYALLRIKWEAHWNIINIWDMLWFKMLISASKVLESKPKRELLCGKQRGRISTLLGEDSWGFLNRCSSKHQPKAARIHPTPVCSINLSN